MNELTAAVRDVIIIAVALSFTEILLPDSDISRYVKFVFSLILIAAIAGYISEFLS